MSCFIYFGKFEVHQMAFLKIMFSRDFKVEPPELSQFCFDNAEKRTNEYFKVERSKKFLVEPP